MLIQKYQVLPIHYRQYMYIPKIDSVIADTFEKKYR